MFPNIFSAEEIRGCGVKRKSWNTAVNGFDLWPPAGASHQLHPLRSPHCQAVKLHRPPLKHTHTFHTSVREQRRQFHSAASLWIHWAVALQKTQILYDASRLFQLWHASLFLDTDLINWNIKSISGTLQVFWTVDTEFKNSLPKFDKHLHTI